MVSAFCITKEPYAKFQAICDETEPIIYWIILLNVSVKKSRINNPVPPKIRYTCGQNGN